jgi:ABC-type enterobactin transport system permease subunit
VIVLLIALVTTVVGVWFGIVLIAPRISRALDRADANQSDEEPGDRPD